MYLNEFKCTWHPFSCDMGLDDNMISHIIIFTLFFNSHINIDALGTNKEFYRDVILNITGWRPAWTHLMTCFGRTTRVTVEVYQ